MLFLNTQLLDAIAPLRRGLGADAEQRAEVDALCRGLERSNPSKASLSAPEVNGKWELLYTTSDSILGASKPPPLRPWGPIYQLIDVDNLRARNQETWPLFNAVRVGFSLVVRRKERGVAALQRGEGGGKRGHGPGAGNEVRCFSPGCCCW